MPASPDRTSTCRHCRHVLWMVALGYGVRCGHQANRTDDGATFAVPRRDYRCDHFETKPDAAAGDEQRPGGTTS